MTLPFDPRPAPHRRSAPAADCAYRAATGRARPLSPDERRAALVEATLPLVATHGPKVTTRQIAQAAGVAEGTIFRVFPDKEALIRAALKAALDPAPLLRDLAAVDLSTPLRERLTQTTGILQERLISIINLMVTVGRDHPPEEHVDAHRASVRPTNDLIHEAIARVIEPDSDRLSVPVQHAARLLRLLTFSGSHPMITEGELLTPDEIVSVLLDGVCRHPDPSD